MTERGHRARSGGRQRAAIDFVVAAVAAALVVGACQSTQTPTTSSIASGLESPSAVESGAAGSPSASPGSSVLAPTPALQVNIAVQITVTSLNVRSSPTTSAMKVGSMAKGDVAALIGYGGIQSGGYTWFEAARVKGLHGPLPPLPTFPLQGGDWTDLVGWIATGSATTPWVEPLAARCPTTTVDLATLSAMLLGEQLACLGSMPLVLEGTFGCGGCGGTYPGTFTPEWLATPLSGLFSVDPSVGVGPLQLYFPPGVARPIEGQILRVHGHLDDARSATCAVSVVVGQSPTAAPVALRPGDAAIWCRQHLVVDSYEVLGVNPSFPPH